MNWFKQDDTLRKLTAEQIRALEEEVKELENKIRVQKLEHKIAEEDTKHMVKLKEERLKNDYDNKNRRLDIDFEMKKVKLVHDKDVEVAAIKDTYRDKTEKALKKHMDQLGEMYGQIVERLPDVNYAIQHDIGRNGTVPVSDDE